MAGPTPMDGEPTFDLMARDPFAPALVRLWAAQRRLDVRNGHRPVSDLDQIERAERTAERMEDWRRDADEAWRNQPELPLAARDDVDGTLYTPGVPEADKGRWIVWTGGDCPVSDDDAIVSVVLFNGIQNSQRAGNYIWAAGIPRGPSDIVRYRVVS